MRLLAIVCPRFVVILSGFRDGVVSLPCTNTERLKARGFDQVPQQHTSASAFFPEKKSVRKRVLPSFFNASEGFRGTGL